MINIVGNRKYFFSFSGLLVLLSVIFIFIFGLKPGIDFTGGSLIEVNFTEMRPELADMQAVFSDDTYGNVRVQPTEELGYILKMKFISEEEHQEILKKLRDKFETGLDTNKPKVEVVGSDTSLNIEGVKVVSADKKDEHNSLDSEKKDEVVENRMIEDRIETIGPAISSQLKSRSYEAAIAVILAIIVYVGYAFRRVSKPVKSWKYGITAVIALIHDVVITIGIFAVLGKYFAVEIDIPFVVAMLTILGYSVNDTIVVFDRVRENLIKYGYDNFAEIVNKGVNETLVRSLNTSITTLLVLGALFFFGGASIHYFSLALIIGIFFGTYSSIFLASPLLVVWKKLGDR